MASRRNGFAPSVYLSVLRISIPVLNDVVLAQRLRRPALQELVDGDDLENGPLL
jgi:hypothetical protein